MGHLPGVELSHDFRPATWRPTLDSGRLGVDWRSVRCIDAGVASRHCGGFASIAKFDPEGAFQLIEDFGVRNAFLPPTALKMMRSVQNPRARWRLDLRSIASGGESLGRELLTWGRDVLPDNQRVLRPGGMQHGGFLMRANHADASWSNRQRRARPPSVHCRRREARPWGRYRRQYRGGEPGSGHVLSYWNNETATADKFAGDWLLTGDRGKAMRRAIFDL